MLRSQLIMGQLLMGRLHKATAVAAAVGFALGCTGVFAGQIPTSVGSVILTGNDGGNPSGSFRIQADYSVYDGADAGDPLGVTADYQVVFKLTHLGSDGEDPALSMGRFSVFPPDQTVPYYTSIQSAPDGGKAPSTMVLQPPNTHRGLFYFQDVLIQADFDPGDVSDLLVLTVAPVDLPSSVIIEGNFTDTVPGVHADTIIDLIPEPGMASIMLLGTLVALRRRAGRGI